MSLPSHRYYQPPNLGRVKYRAEGRFGNTMNIQSLYFDLLLHYQTSNFNTFRVISGRLQDQYQAEESLICFVCAKPAQITQILQRAAPPCRLSSFLSLFPLWLRLLLSRSSCCITPIRGLVLLPHNQRITDLVLSPLQILETFNVHCPFSSATKYLPVPQ